MRTSRYAKRGGTRIFDPKESKLIIKTQEKVIKKLRDGIDEIKKQAEDNLNYADKNRRPHNKCVEKVGEECKQMLFYLDNRNASLKLKLEGTDRGQMKLGDGN